VDTTTKQESVVAEAGGNPEAAATGQALEQTGAGARTEGAEKGNENSAMSSWSSSNSDSDDLNEQGRDGQTGSK